MTEDQDQMIRDVHEFLFKPAVPGSSITRAQQIEELLNAARSGKFIARLALWAAGAVIALGTAWQMLRSGGGN